MSTATDITTRTPGRAREVHERGAVSERAGARSHESRANVERFQSDLTVGRVAAARGEVDRRFFFPRPEKRFSSGAPTGGDAGVPDARARTPTRAPHAQHRDDALDAGARPLEPPAPASEPPVAPRAVSDASTPRRDPAPRQPAPREHENNDAMVYQGGPDAAKVRIAHPRIPRAAANDPPPRVRSLRRRSRAAVVADPLPPRPPRALIPPCPPRSLPRVPSPSPQRDTETLKKFESMDPGNNPEVTKLLEEMRAHTEALNRQRKHEDPRLSFSTPEYKEFSRKFSDNFKKNFGRPIEWGLVKRFPWSIPQLEKLEHPVDPDGNPWPLDDEGKPILKE
jgi:hypothetical protein